MNTTTTLYSCRKCYILLRRGQNALLDAQHYLTDHTPRTKEHYLIAASSADRASLISNAPEEGKTTSAKDLSFKNRGTDDLLRLEAYNPQQDTPTEILHTVLLGVAKYLVNDLVKIVLTKQQLVLVNNRVKEYRDATGYSRLFNRELSHCGSFLVEIIRLSPISQMMG